ncbi:MAG TPA: 3'-5' exonuclease, partial [Acidimicrobiales bacterium]|nr:3'-5' exonuclease [Acidimicrobiales bacterium]
VHARRILRHDADARAALRARYRRLLIDEFQDTDPLQVELAAWLASAVDGSGDLAAARPAALFVVGDPRQSIYRFRRADIALFEQVCAEVGEEVHLDTNFRSVPGILEFVNAVFAELFGAGALSGQAVHHPLHPARRPLPGTLRAGTGVQLQLAGLGPAEEEPPSLALPPVVLLGGPVEGSVGDARRAGARHAAATIRLAVEEGWVVGDPRDPSRLRTARWADVAVLIPTRTSLPPLEEAFDEAGIPYRLEGAALLWGSDDVRDVLCALAAAEEPSDAVSVLAALRTPGLGCGDDDLVDWHAAGGSWDPRAEVPPTLAGHPVARAMAVLAELHRHRWWHEPSELVTMTIDRLRALPLAYAQRRPRDHWHRLRWLADQVRLFDDSVGGTLHDFLRWAEIQRRGDGRASVLGPPEPDDDAVRVMTVHGSKGLEFPIVVMAGLERDDSAGQRADAVLWTDAVVPEVRAGLQLRSAGYDAAAEHDRFLDRLERVRLLYVAMTRARDHLVLCLHHKARNGSAADTVPAAQLADIARAHPLLWRRIAEPEEEVADATPAPRRRAAGAGAGPGRGQGPNDEEPDWVTTLTSWSAARQTLVREGRRLAVVTASGLAAAADGTDADVTRRDDGTGPPSAIDPGWAEPVAVAGRSGDVGLDIGRAVHGALAALDLDSGVDPTGRSAAEVARGRAAAHGLASGGTEAAAVEAMVHAALASDVVRRAARRPHHKEMFVSCAPDGPDGGVFEGFVDLLVEDEDGLVVVDYKTDRLVDAESERHARERYGRQVAAYAEAVEAATGRPVVRCVLLFLADGAARAAVLQGEELAEARRTARRLTEVLLAAPAP